MKNVQKILDIEELMKKEKIELIKMLEDAINGEDISKKVIAETLIQISKEKSINEHNDIELKRNKGRVSGKKLSFDYGQNLTYKEITLIKDSLESKFSSDICYSDGKFNVFSSITKDIRNNRSYEISERIPIIKTFRFDDFTSFVQPDSNIIVEAINSFLQEPSQKLCEIIQGELKIYLQNMKICIYSEYVFSSMFFKYLAEACYKNKWKDIIIFSIDSKMEIISDTLTTEKKINNIRCDLILICNNKLYIFEYKYRYDRYNSQADDALKCIKDRGYRYHVAEHLQRHYSDIYNKIESIVLVGMGYSYFKEKVNCEMKYELVNLPI